MTYEKLREIIIGRMQEFTGISQDRIDYQAGLFTPPAPVIRQDYQLNYENLWCRLVIQTAKPVTQGLCEPRARIPGNIIIQCFDRATTMAPTLPLVKLADDLAAHFQYWEAPGITCREAQLINVGTGSSVGDPSGTGFVQTNVSIYFITD